MKNTWGGLRGQGEQPQERERYQQYEKRSSPLRTPRD